MHYVVIHNLEVSNCCVYCVRAIHTCDSMCTIPLLLPTLGE
jgi:hypothetical protein